MYTLVDIWETGYHPIYWALFGKNQEIMPIISLFFGIK